MEADKKAPDADEQHAFDAGEKKRPARAAFVNRERDILLSGLGIVREEGQMEDALRALRKLDADTVCETEKNRLLLGEAMLRSALARKESRGAHYRADYPNRDEAYQKMTLVEIKDGKVVTGFQVRTGKVWN